MIKRKFERILRRRILSEDELEKLARESTASGIPLEELLISKGISKHEILFCLSEFYGLPYVEYAESVIASYFLVLRLDLEHLKKNLWFPLSVREKRAEVIAYRPDDPRVEEDIKKTLGVEQIDFRIALPADII